MVYTELSDKELTALADKDDPTALYEKGRRFLAAKKLAKARPFLILSSTLGDPFAHYTLAGIYEEEDNFEEAYELYALAYGKGVDKALPKLAKLLLLSDRALAIEILKSNAHEGNVECLKILVAALTENGETKELKFWKARLDALTPKEPKTGEMPEKVGKAKDKPETGNQ